MRQRISAERGIALGVGLALVLQTVNGYFAYRAATDYVQAAKARRGSLQILQHSEGLLSLLKDAETGQRGYLLTGDGAYLKPYRIALRDLSEARRRLQEAAGADYRETLNELEPLIDQRFAEMGETIDLRLSDPVGGPAAAQAVVRGGEGKRLMDELRDKIGALEDRERVHLAGINENMDRLASDTPTRVLLVSSLAVVLVGAAGWVAYRDVRRRTLAEAKVREQRSILDSVLDNISDGVLLADAAGQLQLINPAAQRMHRQDGTHIPQSRWSEGFGLYRLDGKTLVPNDELPLARALRGEHVEQAELILKPPRASEAVYLGVSGRPVIDADGFVRGGVIVIRDITRQKRAELRDQEIREELERLVEIRTADLRRSNAELQHKNQENEMFVYSVSHDLRSPLVNLQGFSQELSMACEELRRLFNEADVPPPVRSRGLTVLDDDVGYSVRFIQSAVVRLADIINALLKLSRAGRVEYQIQAVPLGPLVARIVDSLHSELAKRGAAVEVGPLPDAWGDPTAIGQVFANLLDNAVKYLDPARPGRIEVGVDPQTQTYGFHTFFVRDNGLGLPNVGRDKVFKAFERFHPTHAPGDGMGLAIVRRIVDRHGGEIRVESASGEGSVFYVTLPSPPVDGAAATPSLADSPSTQAHA